MKRFLIGLVGKLREGFIWIFCCPLKVLTEMSLREVVVFISGPVNGWISALMLPDAEDKLVERPWISDGALIHPDMLDIEVVKVRFAATAAWVSIVMEMLPEVVLMRRSAGLAASSAAAGWGTTMTLTEPEMVVMERVS